MLQNPMLFDIYQMFRILCGMFTESKHSYKDLAVKISIELTELRKSYHKRNCPDILERIELKEQLLKQIRELLVQETRAVETALT